MKEGHSIVYTSLYNTDFWSVKFGDCKVGDDSVNEDSVDYAILDTGSSHVEMTRGDFLRLADIFYKHDSERFAKIRVEGEVTEAGWNKPCDQVKEGIPDVYIVLDENKYKMTNDTFMINFSRG